MPDMALLLLFKERLWCLGRNGELSEFDPECQEEECAICLSPEILVRQFPLVRENLIDLSELWTFVYPLHPPLETLHELLAFLDLPALAEEVTSEDALLAFRGVLHELLALACAQVADDERLYNLMAYLHQARWVFAPALCARLGMGEADILARGNDGALSTMVQAVKKWSESPPGGRGDLGVGISSQEALEAFHAHLPDDAEMRVEQQEYAKAAQRVFSAESHIVQANETARVSLLQAGTGIGKTRAYLASAQLWAERNDEAVWITTYSRHLQDQIASEVKNQGKAEGMVVRKGRENYLCLLNFDELARGHLAIPSTQRALLGLLARWMAVSSSGIMVGGDFPLWLEERLEGRFYHSLRLKRGECLYRACAHYSRCFLENAVRESQRAKLVVANHALTLRLAAKQQLPNSRIIVDEAHQLFDATDSATQVRLGLSEVRDLQRWLFGGAGKNRKRIRRGLAQRFSGLEINEGINAALRDVQTAGKVFADVEGMAERILAGEGIGVMEEFFQIVARQFPKDEKGGGYEKELAPGEIKDTKLREQAHRLYLGFQRLHGALKRLVLKLDEMGRGDDDDLETNTLHHCSAIRNVVEEYPLAQLDAWLYLLLRLQGEEAAVLSDGEGSRSVVERLYWQPAFERRAFDTGIEMAFLDPCEILQDWLYGPPQKAVLLTSASLEISDQRSQNFAYMRTGLQHLHFKNQPVTALHAQGFCSPFDYANKACAYLATDVNYRDEKAVAAAMQALFLASRGGALGLFTAIRRAKFCYSAIKEVLKNNEITLYSQHDDQAGNMLLTECMRAQRNACLLATDAFRDGVDIPGQALRLVVLERIPWPQPNLLHRHRKLHFGRQYDLDIARQHLQQAFGRLIRSSQDRGSFVVFGNRIPSVLLGGLPIPVHAMSLRNIVQAIAEQNPSPNT